MNVDKQEIKALALACDPAKCADEAEEGRRLAEFYSELTPEAVLALLAEIESTESRLHDVAALCATVEQERDQLKAENEAIRAEAKRQEEGLREMLRRQNKQLCSLKGKRHD